MRSFAVLALVGLVACGSEAPPPAATVPASAVAADPAPLAQAVDRWHAAAAAANEGEYFAAFTNNAVFLGTDGRERWSVDAFRAYAHPHFATGKAWTMKSVRREFTFAPGNELAWFDEDLDTEKLGHARGSGVVVHAGDGRWLIAQYNLSIPIPNERFPEVEAVIDGRTGATPTPTPVPTTNFPTIPPPTKPTTPTNVKPEPAACIQARQVQVGSPTRNRLEAQCRAAGGIP